MLWNVLIVRKSSRPSAVGLNTALLNVELRLGELGINPWNKSSMVVRILIVPPSGIEICAGAIENTVVSLVPTEIGGKGTQIKFMLKDSAIAKPTQKK
jgi:hypothetical protein